MNTAPNIEWRIATTPEEKDQCYRLRSKGYRRFYRHIPPERFIDEVDEECLPDGRPRALSVMMTEQERIVGTGRAVLYHSTQFPGLQSELDLLFNIDREQLMQQLKAESGINRIRSIGELGRFTLLKPSSSDMAILRLFQGYAHIMELLDLDVFIAIAFPWLQKRMANVGIHLHPVEGFRLNRNDIEALLYMVRYFDYFFPRLNLVLPDVEDERFIRTTRMTLFELRSIIDGVYPQDVVYLYWISPANVREAIAAVQREDAIVCYNP